jgi:uncharacterized protein (TIGR03067 family)
VVSVEHAGKKGTDPDTKGLQLIFTDDKVFFNKDNTRIQEAKYKANPSAKPRTIDVTHLTGRFEGQTFRGIYELEGDTLRICWSESGQKRPMNFATKADTADTLLVLKWAKR